VRKLAVEMYRISGKRLFDLVLVTPTLIVLSPVLCVLALLVRTKLGSPVLFCQERPGLHGKPFTLYKFRTMTDAKWPDGRLLLDEKRLILFASFLHFIMAVELPSPGISSDVP